MKKMSFTFCYVALPVAAAIGVKVYLDRRKCRMMHEPEGLCLRPVKWKLFLEK